MNVGLMGLGMLAGALGMARKDPSWRDRSSERDTPKGIFGVGPEGPYFVGPGGTGYVNTPAALAMQKKSSPKTRKQLKPRKPVRSRTSFYDENASEYDMRSAVSDTLVRDAEDVFFDNSPQSAGMFLIAAGYAAGGDDSGVGVTLDVSSCGKAKSLLKKKCIADLYHSMGQDGYLASQRAKW